MQVEPNDTFGEVCSALCKSNGLKISEHGVFYRGIEVSKLKSMKQAGVGEGDTVKIKQRGLPTASIKRKQRHVSTVPEKEQSNDRVLIDEEGSNAKSNAKNNKNSQEDNKNFVKNVLEGHLEDNADLTKSIMASLKNKPTSFLNEIVDGNILQDMLSNESTLVSYVRL